MDRIPHEVTLREETHDVPAESSGCMIRGCLTAVVVLFVVLLGVMVFLLATREWPTPPPLR